MQGRIDFELAARIGLQSLTSWAPRGKMHGKNYFMPNPEKSEDKKLDSFSINIETGKWANFSSPDNAGNDATSLYAYLNHCGQGDAAKAIIERYGIGFTPEPQKPKEPPLHQVLVPIPPDVAPPTLEHGMYGKPARQWLYTDEIGQRIFYVARYDIAPGEKQIYPWSYCFNTKKDRDEWVMKAPHQPLPIYNLARLIREPGAPVLIVEGEKAADAAQAVLTGWVVVTWHGGVNRWKHANWQPLAGRDCVLWPDGDLKKDQAGGLLAPEDQPGMKAMLGIKSLLREIAGSARIVKVAPGKADGWDVADAIEEGWTETDLLGHLRKPADSNRMPYRALGFDHDLYYFISGRTRQIVNFSARQLSKSALCTLAPLDDWEREYAGGGKRNGPDWDRAVDDLIQSCVEAGPYDNRKLRGRGAWFDNDRIVIHLGDRILWKSHAIGGQFREEKLFDFETRYVYEQRRATDSPDISHADTDAGRKVQAILDRYVWENPIDALFMAGWCVVAPICGALSWRPHVWLTGPSGSGKSTLQTGIIHPMLGSAAVTPIGASSEAGIRQELEGDAFPVIIDESEGNDQRMKDRIKNLLFLARGSSSEGTGSTLRGTISGRAQSFSVRSCFLFSSKGIGLDDVADESRFTVVSLKPDLRTDRVQRWSTLKRDTESLFTAQFCKSLRARTINMIPVIRANARVLSRVAAEVLGTQRIGDQVGILLAGARSLVDDGELTEQQAREWLESLKSSLSEQRNLTEHKDEEILLQSLMIAGTRVTDGERTLEISIGELVQRARGKPGPRIDENDARQALLRMGIKIEKDDDACHIANSHDAIKRILKDTPWGSNYGKVLKRLNYAQAGPVTRFAPGFKARCTILPLRAFMDDDIIDIQPELLP